MKLSEAILLGDSLKKPDAATFLSGDGFCGCALGGALIAKTLDKQYLAEFLDPDNEDEEFEGLPVIRANFPWLKGDHVTEISYLYFGVCDGDVTIEQIADYVRSIEPAELTETEIAEQERRDAEREGDCLTTPESEIYSNQGVR